MNILGIDSSGLAASVALLCDDILTGEYTIHNKKTHSQTLLPMIEAMLAMAGIEPQALDAIAVAAGPGSFTGLRIGASTAKGLGLALEIPIVVVPTLEGLAYNLAGCNTMVCPLMDARRNQAYYGIYRWKKGIPAAVIEPAAAPIEEIIAHLNEIGEKTIFVGDGVPVFKQQIKEQLTVPCEWAADSVRYQKAASIVSLGKIYAEQGRCMPAGEFAPLYLRLSQAERERLEKQKG